jgi:type II secretory ATPase GspE/PulE/Tfp pilus assembly ATPase PilB-like protein
MRKLRLYISKNAEVTDSKGVMHIRDIQDALSERLSGGQSGVTDAVDLALCQAAHRGASDLHFEPRHDCLSLRFRVDGILHEVARLPKEYQEKIIARIKILAKMVVYQKDVPQDGRINADETACGKEMRVSTFPTVYGEKTLIRLFDSNRNLLSLQSLGFRDEVVTRLRELIFRPQGTLLLTGPSSSGKTTTIYALLHELETARQPAPHIVTIEDPVEYRLGNISQTQINPHAGFTFEKALRSALRQDPEVIMVGEIRDAETAKTAIQAGLTGHLVISTIHSGTAAGVFTRLLDMGIEPFLIASSVTGVLAQRLVRVNCPHCTASYKPESSLLERFGITDKETSFHRGEGCEECQAIGYSGRVAIGELLLVNEEIADLVLARSRTSVLHEAALRNRMVTLAEDGVEKVRNGATTVEELRRVLPPPVL